MTKKVTWIVIALAVVAIVFCFVVVLARCKVAGDCSREEERRNG